MTRLASMLVDEYLSRLRAELEAAEAPDAEDVVAEVRSLLTEAAGDDADAVTAQIERLGEPEDLARAILADRGVDVSQGMPTRLWWRLGIAAPIDIVIGLSLPLAAAIPVVLIAQLAHPSLAGIPLAAALAVASLGWPLFIWRPWRRGGRSLSPGMSLTGLAVLRAPGVWRLVPLEELRATGVSPNRRIGASVVVGLLSLALLGGAWVLALGSWSDLAMLAKIERARYAEIPEAPVDSFVVQRTIERLYAATGTDRAEAAKLLWSPDAEDDFERLTYHVREKRVGPVGVGGRTRLSAGLHRVIVEEYPAGSLVTVDTPPLGTSAVTIAQRSWPTPDGLAGDWVVIAIEPGAAE